jgi:hypothetical protein
MGFIVGIYYLFKKYDSKIIDSVKKIYRPMPTIRLQFTVGTLYLWYKV